MHQLASDHCHVKESMWSLIIRSKQLLAISFRERRSAKPTLMKTVLNFPQTDSHDRTKLIETAIGFVPGTSPRPTIGSGSSSALHVEANPAVAPGFWNTFRLASCRSAYFA